MFLDSLARGVLHRAGFARLSYFVFRRGTQITAKAAHESAAGSFIVVEESTELTLPSRIESVAVAAEAAAAVARRCGMNEEAAFGLDMAVREAVTNAVLHGNAQDAAQPVEVIFSRADDSGALVVMVRDRGVGFNPEAVADPTAPSNLLKPSGRGLLFMRTFMDEVEWERHPEGGTVVRMTKRS